MLLLLYVVFICCDPCLCCSLLKGYSIQHLPDGTVMVESIVIKVSSSSEDTNTKVLLLSWSYQVKPTVTSVWCCWSLSSGIRNSETSSNYPQTETQTRVGSSNRVEGWGDQPLSFLVFTFIFSFFFFSFFPCSISSLLFLIFFLYLLLLHYHLLLFLLLIYFFLTIFSSLFFFPIILLFLFTLLFLFFFLPFLFLFFNESAPSYAFLLIFLSDLILFTSFHCIHFSSLFF